MGANLFKNANTPSVGNSWVATYAAPVGKASMAVELDIACVGATGVQASARVFDSSASTYTYLVKGAEVPLGSSLQIIDGQKVVLEANDTIEVMCETTGEVVDVNCSIIEDIN